jgi:CRP/FNR family transcriptional regulator, cyclic AMP receptor protein
MDWPLLDGLDEVIRRDVLAQARRRRFNKRDILFHEGDPSDGMHLVESGWVAVRLTTPLGDVVTSAVLGSGEPLGEQSLIEDGGRRSTSAVALTPVETLYLSREIFDDLRRRHPSVDRFLATLFDDRMRRLSTLLIEALHVPAPKRVMRRIAALAEQFAPESDGTIPLTQEDLASLAGTTRPTVNRVLREAEDAGAVRVTRGRLQVVDNEVLFQLAR